MRGVKEILKSRIGLFSKIFAKKGYSDEEWRYLSNRVFRCTLCGNCEEVCPVGIRLKTLWLSLCQDLVHSEFYPEKIDMIQENLKQTYNVFVEDNEDRADWVDDMPDAHGHGYLKEQAEVVYFTGCVAAFLPLAQRIPIALAKILDVSRVGLTLLGEDEWCCGFPLLGAGLKDMFHEFRDHNLEKIREKGAKKIIFACPSCFLVWREYYPRDVEIVMPLTCWRTRSKKIAFPLKSSH